MYDFISYIIAAVISCSRKLDVKHSYLRILDAIVDQNSKER